MKKNDKKIEKQETELENQLKRALADYQNLEKRIAQEKSSWIKTSNKDLILRLLPGIDSLLLAEKHTENPGVKISIDQMLTILRNEGVEKIDTIGRNFDPELMEAVATKQGEEGKVLEEVKTGYTLSGRIIRPAQVIVGKKGN